MESSRFAELPTSRLQERLLELKEYESIPHTPERRLQLAREAAHIAFELSCRQNELNNFQDD